MEPVFRWCCPSIPNGLDGVARLARFGYNGGMATLVEMDGVIFRAKLALGAPSSKTSKKNKCSAVKFNPRHPFEKPSRMEKIIEGAMASPEAWERLRSQCRGRDGYLDSFGLLEALRPSTADALLGSCRLDWTDSAWFKRLDAWGQGEMDPWSSVSQSYACQSSSYKGNPMKLMDLSIEGRIALRMAMDPWVSGSNVSRDSKKLAERQYGSLAKKELGKVCGMAADVICPRASFEKTRGQSLGPKAKATLEVLRSMGVGEDALSSFEAKMAPYIGKPRGKAFGGGQRKQSAWSAAAKAMMLLDQPIELEKLMEAAKADGVDLLAKDCLFEVGSIMRPIGSAACEIGACGCVAMLMKNGASTGLSWSVDAVVDATNTFMSLSASLWKKGVDKVGPEWDGAFKSLRDRAMVELAGDQAAAKKLESAIDSAMDIEKIGQGKLRKQVTDSLAFSTRHGNEKLDKFKARIERALLGGHVPDEPASAKRASRL